MSGQSRLVRLGVWVAPRSGLKTVLAPHRKLGAVGAACGPGRRGGVGRGGWGGTCRACMAGGCSAAQGWAACPALAPAGSPNFVSPLYSRSSRAYCGVRCGAGRGGQVGGWEHAERRWPYGGTAPRPLPQASWAPRRRAAQAEAEAPHGAEVLVDQGPPQGDVGVGAGGLEAADRVAVDVGDRGLARLVREPAAVR